MSCMSNNGNNYHQLPDFAFQLGIENDVELFGMIHEETILGPNPIPTGISINLPQLQTLINQLIDFLNENLPNVVNCQLSQTIDTFSEKLGNGDYTTMLTNIIQQLNDVSNSQEASNAINSIDTIISTILNGIAIPKTIKIYIYIVIFILFGIFATLIFLLFKN